MAKVLNKQVAIAPFKKESLQDKPKAKGLDFTDVTITKLISSEVMFDSDNFKKGDLLYFRSDILRIAYVNQKLNLEGTEFVLVPEELAVARTEAKQ